MTPQENNQRNPKYGFYKANDPISRKLSITKRSVCRGSEGRDGSSLKENWGNPANRCEAQFQITSWFNHKSLKDILRLNGGSFNVHWLLADCIESLLILRCMIVVWAYKKMYDWHWVIHCPVLSFCLCGKVYNRKLWKK